MLALAACATIGGRDEVLSIDSAPRGAGVIMPMVGHQPHYTHAEGLAQAVTDWCLPCAPGGCPSEQGPRA